jgi:hypothetical protein
MGLRHPSCSVFVNIGESNMNAKSLILVLFCATSLAASPLAMADPPHKAHKAHKHQQFKEAHPNKGQKQYSQTNIVRNYNSFSTSQHQLLSSLFSGRNSSVWTPSYRQQLLAQQDLPPGILKNLQRGKPLPPGLAKKLNYMPMSTYNYLGIPYNRHHRLGTVGRNVILYDIATGIVRDILWKFF